MFSCAPSLEKQSWLADLCTPWQVAHHGLLWPCLPLCFSNLFSPQVSCINVPFTLQGDFLVLGEEGTQ